MMFRGVMVEKGCMKEFYNITMMLSKLSRECIMRLTKETIFFVVTQEEVSSAKPPLVWCELDQKAFFNEYTMTGVNEDHNEIYLSFSPSYLNNSLITLKQNVRLMNIKLTKKDQPYLSLKFELLSLLSQEIHIIRHDIPVMVIPRKCWSEYKQPSTPQPDISVVMPSLKRIKHVLERLKSFSPIINLQINKNGLLTIEAETDMATISINFQNLMISDFYLSFCNTPQYLIHNLELNTNNELLLRIAENNISTDQDMISCPIKIKKLHLFLSAEQVQHTRAVGAIKSDDFVHINLENQEIVKIDCYIPAVSL